jgi:transposase
MSLVTRTPLALEISRRDLTNRVNYDEECHRVFNLILWVLYTGMQWKSLPVPTDPIGKPAIHYTTVYKVFAKWADDGSLWQAFVASVAHLSAEKHLDLSILHGDGTNTVAKKGGMALATPATNTRKGKRSSP